MSSVALESEPLSDGDADALRAGRLVAKQLHALGMSDEEIAPGEPVMLWPRSSQPHIEVLDDRGVVFTWNDGRSYADLAVAPDGRVTWFVDDMTASSSGACEPAQALPEEFRQFIEAMHSGADDLPREAVPTNIIAR